ncbi:hypothetical protein EKO23_02545 [Nocardioides guangzhouensis]|uniref:Uncharacterized protein n=1 Tax=Nocardioides guangzhouensis TaxID=2497878 RepID=A0A4Q4ZIY4_9ACTN|nr:hypothetical protein [Nocardioides guangzhouensis]RYP88240.1 hypothetical protein EKO23_02545 [Nocardioides guangzhouensis]
MAPDDETGTGPEKAAETPPQPLHEHHHPSEVAPLDPLPEEEEAEYTDDGPEFEPGPSFGAGM